MASIRRFALPLLALTLLGSSVAAQSKEKRARKYPPIVPDAKEHIYKTVGETRLKLWVFSPPGHQPQDRRAAIIFFFGGGWKSGTPTQFEHHSRYLASRGMVAILADYRVLERHGVKAVECARDAKSAIRWVRRESERLGIDPERIAAGGGSAGGHLAAVTGTISGFDETNEDLSISSKPNALVLFNPAVALAPINGIPPSERAKDLPERLGVEPRQLSPAHHISVNVPPTIIFHGKEDSTVSYRSVEIFRKKMLEAGNRCELVGYEGQTHGFFNYGRANNRFYLETTRKMDEFLASLGYLTGSPTLEASE